MVGLSDRYSRQSFLGEDAQNVFSSCVVGVVGLGGGGSHIIQQLAHIGFLNYVLYDSDNVEYSNLNRLIGATVQDAAMKLSKIEVAQRLIFGLQPSAILNLYKSRWQMHPEPLKYCDIIFGCVDSFSEREQLEAFARRWLIPYIDIGLDVHDASGEPPQMAGQVILSMPGGPCMKCLGLLSDLNLAKEAAMYGAAGQNPQVVWANGILASAAVGIVVDLLTDWTHSMRKTMYLSYQGNYMLLKEHRRLEFITEPCPHYPLEQVGKPILSAV